MKTTYSHVASPSALPEPTADHADPAPDTAEQQLTLARDADQTLYDRLPALVTVRQVAELLGIPRSSLYRYAKDERIPCERLGGRVYIRKIGIRHWLDDRQETQA